MLAGCFRTKTNECEICFFSETNVLCDTRGTNSFFMWTAKLAAKLLAALATRFTASPISRKPPSLHVEYLSFKVDSPTNS